ncbi:SH3/FCH domain protein [Wolffia australiana]
MVPSDLSDRGNGDFRKPRKGPPFKFLVPLIYAPVLPLIRITLRRNPVLRDRLFYGVLAGAFAHGAYLVTDLYDAESK